MKMYPATDGSAAVLQEKRGTITIEKAEPKENEVLRVAAYARVSTASEDQLNSFGAQTRYYSEMISAQENWKLVDVYADEGISGTSMEKRDDFNRMIADCKRGKIDCILVKSISRFARNTKECLAVLRMLKSIGVGVRFEKENIDTFRINGEMMTAVFASMAQAESESISGNMKWSYQQRMQSGTYIACSAAYGYRFESGGLVIHEEEARIVKWIFGQYLSGMSMEKIADTLEQMHIPLDVNHPDRKWERFTIAYILSNEKYLGDSLHQKTYTTDSLPMMRKKNKGERAQYYARDTHPSIISQEEFDAVQALRRRRRSNLRTDAMYAPKAFRKMVFCKECGSLMKEKASRGKRSYVCYRHHENNTECKMLPISTEGMEQAFLRLYYNLKHQGIPLLKKMLSELRTIRSHQMLWSEEIIELNKRIADLSSQNLMLAKLNRQCLVDPDIFIAQSNELTKQLRETKIRKERLLMTESSDLIPLTKSVIELLEDGPDFLAEFDEELFGELIDKIIVESNTCVRFRLVNGLELPEQVERRTR